MKIKKSKCNIFSQTDKKDEQIQNKGKQDEEVIIDYGKAVE
jgi:hypothetical protein